MIIGYARVSSTDQDYDGQIERLKAVGCDRVFSEKVSGSRGPDRQQAP
jgi:DNA invertase Pin-like site-specific DNA recombinase